MTRPNKKIRPPLGGRGAEREPVRGSLENLPRETNQMQVLRDMILETQTGSLYDADRYDTNIRTLKELQRKRFAIHVGDNLWRCTLAAIAYARTGIQPTPHTAAGRRPTTAKHVLDYVRNNPGVTTKELAQALNSDRSTIRQILKRLHEQHHIHIHYEHRNRAKRTMVATPA